ncbi:hypothetical protein Purlil1_12908 [Purpureocillium lilacinum]|uniref:CCHC-type domain-containing protein n=1 Tax=Purpureocillium lilacinum TaxID=33203 RepID=A0ABR0BG76_PURLI|nr:hypothetical protein Purlil1_12908 [Purpureocillium lilacinum]
MFRFPTPADEVRCRFSVPKERGVVRAHKALADTLCHSTRRWRRDDSTSRSSRDPAADHPVPGRDLKDGSADRRLARVRDHTLLSLVAPDGGKPAQREGDVAAESQSTDNMRLHLVAVAAEHASLLGRRSDELGPDVAVAVRQHGVPLDGHDVSIGRSRESPTAAVKVTRPPQFFVVRPDLGHVSLEGSDQVFLAVKILYGRACSRVVSPPSNRFRAALFATLPHASFPANPPIRRSAQPAAAAMASASSSPPRDDDRFNLGPRTPSGLARKARAALLCNSPATREARLASRALRYGHTRRHRRFTREPGPQSGDGPVSIANAAASPQLSKINGNNQPRAARGNAIHCLHRLTTSGSSPASAPARPSKYLEVSPYGPTSPTNSASTGAASRKPILVKPDGPSALLTWQPGIFQLSDNLNGLQASPQRSLTRDRSGTKDSDQMTRTLIIFFAKEVKHYWRLFDTTSYARRITKTRPPKQCDNCWDYHSRYSCGRQPRCKNCGRIGHALDTCTATQQCANCRRPHAVDSSLCPARPKTINGVVRSLNKPEKDRVCRMGPRLFQRHTTKPAAPPEVSTSPESQSATASDTTSTSSRSTPTSSDAITLEPGRETSAAPNSQASPTPSTESSSNGTQNTAASASPIKPTSATPINSSPVRQTIETFEEPNEYDGNGRAPPASPSPARSSLSPAPSVSTPTPSLSSTCLLGTPAPEVRTSSPQPATSPKSTALPPCTLRFAVLRTVGC